MCTRYALLEPHLRFVLVQLGVAPPDPLPRSRYNVPPRTLLPAIRASGGVREFASLSWGLVPAWAKEAGQEPVNARAETVAQKATFRDAFRRRRCLIPASGFYEWESRGRVKQPWLVRRQDLAPFCFAGLWESWQPPGGDMLESCAIITTTPNRLMAPIHDRMPVILTERQWEPWLDPNATEVAVHSLLSPWAPELMTAVTVSSRVNSVHTDDESCLVPAKPDEDPQLELL